MTEIETLLRDAGHRGDPEAAHVAAAKLPAAAEAAGLLDLAYAETDSPLGRLLLVAGERGLVCISYPEHDPGETLERLAERLSPRILEAPARLDAVRRELDEFFAGRRREFDLPVDLALTTPFQRRVLEATRRIPVGEVRTYGEIAAASDSPRAARATGNALGHNPIPIVVPCHRVVAGGGKLGGYTGGLDKKLHLLSLERGELPLPLD